MLRLLVEDVTLRDDHAVVRTIIPTEGAKVPLLKSTLDPLAASCYAFRLKGEDGDEYTGPSRPSESGTVEADAWDPVEDHSRAASRTLRRNRSQ